MNMTQKILDSIAETAAEDLRLQFGDARSDLLDAIEKAMNEAEFQESKPKFAIGFKIAVDLEKNEFDCSLSWSVKQSLTTSHKIEDANQPKLPLESDDTKVTIKTGTTSVETTAKEFSGLARKIRRK